MKKDQLYPVVAPVLLACWKMLALVMAVLTWVSSGISAESAFNLSDGGVVSGGGHGSGSGYAFTHGLGEAIVGHSSGSSFSFVAGFQARDASGGGSMVSLQVTASPSEALNTTENLVRNFTLGVTNRSTLAATGVQLSIQAPVGLRIQSASNSVGTCQLLGNSNVVCLVENLPGNSSFRVDLTVRPSFLPANSPLSVDLGNLLAAVTSSAEENSADNTRATPVTVFAQTDWGDARGGFPVTAAEDGAYHRYSPTGPWLGLRWDNDGAGNHSLLADWDDTHSGSDDEDGIAFSTPLTAGGTALVTVTANTVGFLDAWADFNNDGDWNAPGEHIFAGQPLAAGANTLSLAVPTNAVAGTMTTRWRISTTGGLSQTGYGGVGEVEDHVVNVTVPTVVEFAALPHVSLGGASLVAASTGLQLSNIGSSGQDGVSIGLQELSRTAHLQFAPVSLTRNGAAITFTAVGMIQDQPARSLGTITLKNSGGLVALEVDAGAEPLAATLRVEVINQGTVVGGLDTGATGMLGLLSGSVQLGAVTAGDTRPSASRWILWELDFVTPIQFSGLNGDRIRLSALDPVGALQNLFRLDVTVRGMDSVLMEELNAPAFQPTLRIDREPSSGAISLKWDTRNAMLLRATSPAGPWTRVLEGTSQAQSIPSNREFYKVELGSATDWTFWKSNNLSVAHLATNVLTKRNVLLIVMDDVGVDQVPWYINHYGSTSGTADNIEPNRDTPPTQMPALWRLANSGVTFVNAWSSPTCSPSRACLLTGQYSFRHGVFSPSRPDLPYPSTTIANVLHDAGYATALFGKWHLGETHRPGDFGFDEHRGSLGGAVSNYYQWEKVINGGDPFWESTYATANTTEDAMNWIATQNNPWFAMVAYNAPHSALPEGEGSDEYQMPPPHSAYNERSTADGNRAYYRSTLEALDRSISNLLANIDPVQLKKTTIIVMGDNGTVEDISEHFGGFTPPHTKSSLYEGGVNVPLLIADGYNYLTGEEAPILSGIGRITSPGRSEEAVVQTMDIFATIAAIGHVSASSDSVSLIPYLASATPAAQRSVVYAETYEGGRWNVVVRDATHKLHMKDRGGSPTYELYDLSSDRWEKSPMAEDGTSATATALLNALTDLGVPTNYP